MMDKLDKVAWPAAVVASVALLVTGVLAAGDALGIDGAIVEDAQDALRWLAAMVGAPVLLWLVAQVRSLLADRDRNGVPDVLERPSGRRRRETIRPPDEGGPGAGVALILLGLALGAAVGTSGCGRSAIAGHARAATALAGTLAAAGAVVDEARAAALDQAEAEHPDDPEHDEALIAVHRRFEPIGDALDAGRAAQLTWVASVQAAALAGDDAGLVPLLLPVGLRAIEVYAAAARLASRFGHALPAPPDLTALLGGAR